MTVRSLLLLVALLLPGCAGTAPAPAPPSPTPGRDQLLEDVTDAVEAVDAAEAAADPRLATALTGVRELDGLVARLRDPATVDDARAAWPRVTSAVEAVELSSLRPAFREIAFAVDRARAALATAQAGAPSAWESRYLAAEDRALVAMRAYAEAADALVQVVERHWPTYRSVAEVTGPFVERRWVYRSAEEAAAAYEVELAPYLADLRRAQAEIARYREEREAAATAVNAAADAAAEIFRSRPPRPGRSP